MFLIRHPARMVPSCLRAGQPVFGIDPADEDFRAQTSLGLARVVFDAYDALNRRRRRLEGPGSESLKKSYSSLALRFFGLVGTSSEAVRSIVGSGTTRWGGNGMARIQTLSQDLGICKVE